MYDELIKDLRYLAKVYSICENENTKEYKLAVKAADAIEELSRENDSLAKSVNEASEILHRRWSMDLFDDLSDAEKLQADVLATFARLAERGG